MRIVDGLLYHFEWCSRRFDFISQIVVPEKYRQVVLHLFHNHPVSGHVGDYKLYESIKQKYWWPTLQRNC